MIRRSLCFLLLLAACTTGSAVAQVTRADSAAVLLDAARRFAADRRTDIAEALYAQILERYGDTAAAAQVRQLMVTGEARDSRAGRVELQVWGTLYGLWLGVATPMMLGSEEPEPYGLGLLLGGPAGFVGSRKLAYSRPFSEGQARAITLGGTWGTWQGLGWAIALDLGTDTYSVCPDGPFGGDCVTHDGNREEIIAGLGVLGGVAGMGAGLLMSRKPIDTGLAATVNYGSLWGTWFGLATGILADRESDPSLEATLIGGDVGLLATMALAPAWGWSRTRARLVSLAGIVGGLGGAGIDLLIQPDDTKTSIAIPLITSAAGLALGAWATRTHDAIEGGDGTNGAVIQVRNGDVLADLPVPWPTMTTDATGRRYKPAIGLTLLRAQF